MNLDPTDKILAKKRAREANELDAADALVEDYISRFPTLDAFGFPIDGDDPYLDAQAEYLLGTSSEESDQ